jgi:hypothetical protein
MPALLGLTSIVPGAHISASQGLLSLLGLPWTRPTNRPGGPHQSSMWPSPRWSTERGSCPLRRSLPLTLRGLLIVVGVWLLAILVLVVLGRRSQARELAALIPNLVILFRGLRGDARVPRSSKRWLWFAVAWFLSPIDLVPEFLPVVDPLEDGHRRRVGASARPASNRPNSPRGPLAWRTGNS